MILNQCFCLLIFFLNEQFQQAWFIFFADVFPPSPPPFTSWRDLRTPPPISSSCTKLGHTISLFFIHSQSPCAHIKPCLLTVITTSQRLLRLNRSRHLADPLQDLSNTFRFSEKYIPNAGEHQTTCENNDENIYCRCSMFIFYLHFSPVLYKMRNLLRQASAK